MVKYQKKTKPTFRHRLWLVFITIVWILILAGCVFGIWWLFHMAAQHG